MKNTHDVLVTMFLVTYLLVNILTFLFSQIVLQNIKHWKSKFKKYKTPQIIYYCLIFPMLMHNWQRECLYLCTKVCLCISCCFKICVHLEWLTWPDEAMHYLNTCLFKSWENNTLIFHQPSEKNKGLAKIKYDC